MQENSENEMKDVEQNRETVPDTIASLIKRLAIDKNKINLGEELIKLNLSQSELKAMFQPLTTEEIKKLLDTYMSKYQGNNYITDKKYFDENIHALSIQGKEFKHKNNDGKNDNQNNNASRLKSFSPEKNESKSSKLRSHREEQSAGSNLSELKAKTKKSENTYLKNENTYLKAKNNAHKETIKALQDENRELREEIAQLRSLRNNTNNF